MLCYLRRLGSGLRKSPKDDYGPGKDGFLKPERVGSEVILEVPMFICEKAVKHVEGACCKEGHRKDCRGVIAVCDKPAVLDGTFRK